jgi:hypothetical protein
MSSSHEQLLRASSTVLEKQLDNALAVAPPKNLSDRIFLTSIQDLKDEHPTVIARIGYATKWRELALAACILFAVLIATLVSTQSSEVVPSRDLLATNTVLSVEEEELLLEDLNLSEYSYLADTREIAFADVAVGFDGLRDDIELWQYGLLSE